MMSVLHGDFPSQLLSTSSSTSFFQQSDIIHFLTIECLLTACRSARVCLCVCVHTLKEVEVEETVTRLQKKGTIEKKLWSMNRTNMDIMYN